MVVIVGGLIAYNYFSKNKIGPSLFTGGKTEEKMEEKAPSLPTTHTVADNENLWTIAEKYYQSGYNWVTLAKENNLNNPDYLQAGQVLNIPKAEIIKPESGEISSAAVEPPKTYTVVAGDSLWDIAVRELGDGYAWSKIANANNLVDPNLIHPGNVLTLPR